ncbi:hypothetical protein GH714_017525 [Hevea brasiliensis]|uniref:Dof-type domain-containing protein n=1 Tax=Hevea brasiliensis TaxID=3981 RepID=A0A6A6LPK6_HEVBR|nr:hypothetical protein GH714_017525 [Hevea brasiliensis]
MGLSSKQVSSDGLDWSQALSQGQTLELPKPPLVRRHTATKPAAIRALEVPETCKRHWTKGGTLRNVPLGAGHKSKRLKTSKTTAKASTAAATTSTNSKSTNNGSIINRANPQMAMKAQQQKKNLPLALGDQKSGSGIMCQAMISLPSSALQQNSVSCSSFSGENFNTINNSVFLDSTLSLPQNQGLHFPYSSTSSTFDTHPSLISTSLQSSNLYNYGGEAMEDSTITTVMPTTSSTITQHWQVPNASRGMDMTSYWNWDDIDSFVSTTLNIPWDDSELNP